MSGILGHVRLDGSRAEADRVLRMAGATPSRGGPNLVTTPSEDAALVTLEAMTEHRGSGAGEVSRLADGTLLLSDARIDSELPAAPSKTPEDPPSEVGQGTQDDNRHIADMLSYHDVDLIHHMSGDFAFAAWRPQHRTLVLGRDAMAMRPLYYHRHPDGVYFASEALQLREALGRPGPINSGAVAAFLAADELPPGDSFYDDLSRVPPGSVLGISRSSITHEVRRCEADVPASMTEQEATEEFWALFQTAVANRTKRFSQFGLMLSGGADSTAIGVALKEHEGPGNGTGRAYTWAFDEVVDGDERGPAQVVADLARLPLTGISGDDIWPLKDAFEHGPDEDAPFVWPFQGLNNRTLAHAREDGAATVLTGDRGDAVVGDWVFEGGPRVARPDPPPYLSATLAEQTHDRRAGAAPSSSGSVRDARFQRIFGWSAGQIAEMNCRAFWRKGLVYSDPWSDVRVADWILALPPAWVNRPEERKRILRRALTARGFDPGTLSNKEPSGLFERGLRRREVATVKELFRSPLSGDLGFVEPPVIRKAFDRYVDRGRVAFDLWKPIALELWLRRIHDHPRAL